jgi:hypothetical protein
VERTGEPAERPPDFDLQRAWDDIVATLDERRGMRHITALAEPFALRWLRAQYGTRVTVGAEESDGRLNVDIAVPATHDDPARELSAYADALEVLDPPDVRARLAEIGRLLAARHAG